MRYVSAGWLGWVTQGIPAAFQLHKRRPDAYYEAGITAIRVGRTSDLNLPLRSRGNMGERIGRRMGRARRLAHL